MSDALSFWLCSGSTNPLGNFDLTSSHLHLNPTPASAKWRALPRHSIFKGCRSSFKSYELLGSFANIAWQQSRKSLFQFDLPSPEGTAGSWDGPIEWFIDVGILVSGRLSRNMIQIGPDRHGLGWLGWLGWLKFEPRSALTSLHVSRCFRVRASHRFRR